MPHRCICSPSLLSPKWTFQELLTQESLPPTQPLQMPKSKVASSTMLHLYCYIYMRPIHIRIQACHLQQSTPKGPNCPFTGNLQEQPPHLVESLRKRLARCFFLKRPKMPGLLVSPVIGIAGGKAKDGSRSTPKPCHQKHTPLGRIQSSLNSVA